MTNSLPPTSFTSSVVIGASKISRNLPHSTILILQRHVHHPRIRGLHGGFRSPLARAVTSKLILQVSLPEYGTIASIPSRSGRKEGRRYFRFAQHTNFIGLYQFREALSLCLELNCSRTSGEFVMPLRIFPATDRTPEIVGRGGLIHPAVRTWMHFD